MKTLKDFLKESSDHPVAKSLEKHFGSSKYHEGDDRQWHYKTKLSHHEVTKKLASSGFEHDEDESAKHGRKYGSKESYHYHPAGHTAVVKHGGKTTHVILYSSHDD